MESHFKVEDTIQWKRGMYNEVNVSLGYGTIGIYSPLEVMGYGTEDERL